MQVSGTFPQLSDRSQKQIRKQVTLRSATAMQKGGVVGGAKRLHAGSTAGNRARARQRAGRGE
jgi:hypothetical protein